MTRSHVQKLVLAALFLAMGLLLPFLTGQIPEIGSKLSPMHIPVLLCGFICGWPYGLIVGFITPLMRSFLFTMPPMLTAIPMAFELATYGLMAGILYRLLPKKIPYTYVALILAMIAGRIVWGVASLVVYTTAGNAFTWQVFMAGAFLNAIPGIIVHLILIPAIVIALRKSRLMA